MGAVGEKDRSVIARIGFTPQLDTETVFAVFTASPSNKPERYKRERSIF